MWLSRMQMTRFLNYRTANWLLSFNAPQIFILLFHRGLTWSYVFDRLERD